MPPSTSALSSSTAERAGAFPAAQRREHRRQSRPAGSRRAPAQCLGRGSGPRTEPWSRHRTRAPLPGPQCSPCHRALGPNSTPSRCGRAGCLGAGEAAGLLVAPGAPPPGAAGDATARRPGQSQRSCLPLLLPPLLLLLLCGGLPCLPRPPSRLPAQQSRRRRRRRRARGVSAGSAAPWGNPASTSTRFRSAVLRRCPPRRAPPPAAAVTGGRRRHGHRWRGTTGRCGSPAATVALLAAPPPLCSSGLCSSATCVERRRGAPMCASGASRGRSPRRARTRPRESSWRQEWGEQRR
mmetsp:Transcript_17359/g.65718  ORF Transcript_17359/g.65718 Transcript_17359/m.65718 type:complete len:295 (+) Transcript_17359:145-1029(+)